MTIDYGPSVRPEDLVPDQGPPGAGQQGNVLVVGAGAPGTEERPRVSLRPAVTIPLSGACTVPEVVSFDNLEDGKEHMALSFLGERPAFLTGLDPDVATDGGRPVAPLVRLHSECLTGDALGSLRCDCGPQLREAIELLSRERGVLLYLRQEGRGIGLYNKLAAYRFQDQGLDTYEANRVLDLPDDAREFSVAARMLEAMGLTHVRLLTNNPDKRRGLERHGIVVTEVVPTGVYVTRHNERYLRAKVEKHGHALRLDGDLLLTAAAPDVAGTPGVDRD